jgi:predicted RNase H-like HicB family nuclease
MEVLVRATWDAEASVWVAESDEVPGLITEAPTIEDLIVKLKVLIPELLEANGVLSEGSEEVSFQLMASRQERTRASAA